MVAAEDITRLFARIDASRDALVSLTQDLLRFPRLTRPGADYRAICAYLGEWVEARGGVARPPYQGRGRAG